MLSDSLYEFANRVAGPALALASPFSSKLRRGRRGRAHAIPALERWAATQREPVRPLVWLHAPSVGEALMAQAICSEVRSLRPDAQVAFTFFSPSAERVAERVGADVVSYLPWDTRYAAARVCLALRPAVVAFVRTEIWPAHMAAAARLGARTTLVNAVLADGSSRLTGPARRLLAPAYAQLDAVGAAGDDDARRLPLLGVPAGRIHVTGDARFDQVHARVAGIDRHAPLLARIAAGTAGEQSDDAIIVAGSTWRADEEVVVPAFAALRSAGVPARLVIAPHEPGAAHLAALERRLHAHAVSSVRLAAFEAGAPAAAAIVVDRVGVLADLYAIAAAAFVGGGFGRSGLHSVVEPAALGVPVAFGGAVGNAGEALALAATDGGAIVTDSAALTDVLRVWAADTAARARASAAAHDFVAARLGGARRNADLIVSLIS